MDVICGTSKHAVRIAQELSKANRGESRANRVVGGRIVIYHDPVALSSYNNPI